MWDIAAEKAEKTFNGHADTVTAVAFSPDGKKVLTGSSDKTAKLWDIATEKAEKTFIGHTDEVTAVAFSPDGKKVLTGSKDKTAKLWDIATDAVEDRAYPFSLYEMAQQGLQIEPEDTPPYTADSTAYADKIERDRAEYEQAIAAWEGSAAYKQHMALINSVTQQAALVSVRLKLIEDLTQQIRETEDTLKQYQLYCVLMDTLKGRFAPSLGDYNSSREFQTRLVMAYVNRAWCGFFLKKFKEGEQDIRAGIALDSTDLYLYTLLAPTLLLQGKFTEAKAEYERWKDKELDKANGFPTFKDAFLYALKAFEKAGIIPEERKVDVAAIRKLLEK